VEGDGEKKRDETYEECEARLSDSTGEEADAEQNLEREDGVAALSERYSANNTSLVRGEVGGQGRIARVTNCAAAPKRTRKLTPPLAAECLRAPSKRKTVAKMLAVAVHEEDANSQAEEDEGGSDRECQGVHGVRFPSPRLR
jgi:hypothetical protein